MGGMWWRVVISGKTLDLIRANNRIRANAEAITKWRKYKPHQVITVVALNSK